MQGLFDEDEDDIFANKAGLFLLRIFFCQVSQFWDMQMINICVLRGRVRVCFGVFSLCVNVCMHACVFKRVHKCVCESVRVLFVFACVCWRMRVFPCFRVALAKRLLDC